MKRVLVIFAVAMCVVGAHATCVELSRRYTSCKAGYYLDSGQCIQCPSAEFMATGSTVTSANNNSNGITDCYLPSGVYTDAGGTFETGKSGENCPHR